MRIYHDDTDAPMKFILEAYDNGYLLTGKHNANYSKYNWLIKTDVNGEILWEKTIGNGVNSIVFLDITQDDSGNIYLGGSTKAYDPEGDPLIMKLDSCGEKEWCRIFYTEENHDFSSCISYLPDGGIACVLLLTNPLPWIDRKCLAKLSPSGEFLWKQCYNSTDTSQRSEDIFDLIQTPDDGFLLTGFCYYEDPLHPNLWWLHPYLLKTDSIGNFEWETVIYKETHLEGGIAWNTVISPDSLYFYTSMSHYFHETNYSSPALAKLDLAGNVLGVYDVVYGYTEGKLSSAQFLNDSILAASADWGNTDDSLWSRAVIIDTLGNLLNSTILMEDLYTSILQVTYDGKLLYASNAYQNGQFDCYLTKLNQDLDQDTIYTMPFTYDSLCPYPIVSDTIGQDDCGLIVGIPEEEEKGRRGEEEMVVELWPNPCSTVLSISLTSRQSVGQLDSWQLDKLRMEVYDIFGRKAPIPALSHSTPSPAPIHSTPSPALPLKGKGEVVIDISSLRPGLYLLVVKDGRTVKATAKFVVAR